MLFIQIFVQGGNRFLFDYHDTHDYDGDISNDLASASNVSADEWMRWKLEIDNP